MVRPARSPSMTAGDRSEPLPRARPHYITGIIIGGSMDYHTAEQFGSSGRCGARVPAATATAAASRWRSPAGARVPIAMATGIASRLRRLPRWSASATPRTAPAPCSPSARRNGRPSSAAPATASSTETTQPWQPYQVGHHAFRSRGAHRHRVVETRPKTEPMAVAHPIAGGSSGADDGALVRRGRPARATGGRYG